jgi:hypothetical protein
VPQVLLAFRYEPLLDQPKQVPHVVQQICDTLEREAVHLVGVFRLTSPEAKTAMAALKQAHAQFGRLSTLRYVADPMTLANLLVLMLASLPQSLIPSTYYTRCAEMGLPLLRLGQRTAEARWATLSSPLMTEVLDRLPVQHWLVLLRLLEMLQKFAAAAAVNLMNAQNLGTALAPAVFRLPTQAHAADAAGRQIGEGKSAQAAALASLLRLLVELGPNVLVRDGARKRNGNSKPGKADWRKRQRRAAQSLPLSSGSSSDEEPPSSRLPVHGLTSANFEQEVTAQLGTATAMDMNEVSSSSEEEEVQRVGIQ